MTRPQLVATAWTSAGDTSPMRVPATSPVPIAERVAAVADAGFTGFGLIADDLLAIRDSIGFAALRRFDLRRRLTHVEIELIERWWIPRGEAGHSYDVRDLLFEAADVLAPVFIKIGSELGPRHCRSTSSRRTAARILPSRQPHTALGSPSRRCRSRSSRPCRWEPKSSLQPLIRRPDCWWMPGTYSAQARRWRSYAAALAPEMIFGVELDDAGQAVVGTLSKTP